MEADPALIDEVVSKLDLSNAKPVTTPFVRAEYFGSHLPGELAELRSRGEGPNPECGHDGACRVTSPGGDVADEEQDEIELAGVGDEATPLDKDEEKVFVSIPLC